MTELTTENQDALYELIRACLREQPTLGLFDGAEPVRWLGVDGERQVVSLGGQHGTLDPGTGRFVPTDPEPVRLLLVEKLRAVHGDDARFPIGYGSTGVDWDTVEILVEAEGRISAVAERPRRGSRLLVVIEADWQVRVEPLVARPDLAEELATDLARSLAEALQADPSAPERLRAFDDAHPVGSPGRAETIAAGVRLAVAEQDGGPR